MGHGQFVKGGTYVGLKVHQLTYGLDERCYNIGIPPLFKKGG